MNFGNVVCGTALGLALMGFAGAADATVFRIDSLSFGGDAFTESASDPGLVVQTHSLAPIQFELNGVGDTAWVQLFEIWSEECCVDVGDTSTRSFSLGLHFDLPPPPFDAGASGETDGGFVVPTIFGLIPVGLPFLSWTDDVVDIAFGPRLDGVLQLELFGTGFQYNCHEDAQQTLSTFHHEEHTCRKTVKGLFTLISEATPPTDVPEPATLALLGAGLFGLGMLRRRRAA